MSRYGPNTEAVEALIEKIKKITPEQVERLAMVPSDVESDIRRDVFARNARGDIQESDFSVEWAVTWKAVCHAGSKLFQHPHSESVIQTVAAAIYETTIATFAKDLISSKVFTVLYGPWASVMEPQN